MAGNANAGMTVNTEKKTPIIFQGTGSDYFKIWLVNWLLCIVTLGIYSPWAKVRTKKYFCQHTTIDGTGFDYHARPIDLLKGRFLMVFFVFLSVFMNDTIPILYSILSLASIIIIPWFILSAHRFHAKYTSFRGLRFSFVGDIKGAIQVYGLWPMLVPITLGFITPLITLKAKQYFGYYHAFGQVNFKTYKTGNNTFKIMYQKVFFSYLILFLALTTIMWMLGLLKGGGIWQAIIFGIIAFGIISTYLMLPTIENSIWNTLKIHNLTFQSTLCTKEMLVIYSTNSLLTVLTLGFFTPFAKVRLAKYRAEHLVIIGDIDFSSFTGDSQASNPTNKLTGSLDVGSSFDIGLG